MLNVAMPLLARWSTANASTPGGAANVGGRDLRDWEWHYLERQLDQSDRILEGHSGAVHFVAIRPDDGQVATVGGFDIAPGRGESGDRMPEGAQERKPLRSRILPFLNCSEFFQRNKSQSASYNHPLPGLLSFW